MAHHGSKPDEQISEAFLGQFNKAKETLDRMTLATCVAEEFGPTGKFPEGKHTESDEGEIMMGVAVDRGKVILNLGKPTAWVGMTPEQAIELGGLLVSRGCQVIDSPLRPTESGEDDG